MASNPDFTRRHFLGGLSALTAAATFGGSGIAFAQAVGDTLVVGQTGDIMSLDPAYRLDTLTGIVQKHLYSSVLSRMPDMSVGPGVAKTAERVSPTKWRLVLREGMRFSNGEPVDAEAVKYTIARLNAEETKSPIKSFFVNLKSVEIESPYVVTIETEAPDALFQARMTNLQLVPPKYTAGVGLKFNEAPIGSGPYTLDRWRRNEEVVLLANPTYGGEVKPKYKRIVFRPVPEEIARISAVKTGAAHLVTSLSPNQAASLSSNEDVQVLKVESNRVMVVQFNPFAEPATNPLFRRAVGLAINRDELIKGLMKGYASPVKTIYASSIQGVPADAQGDFPYNPNEAKKIIEDLGLKGKEIELAGAAGRYPLDRETALAVGAQLRRVGLDVKVRTEEYGSFATKIKSNTVAPIFIQPHGNVWLDPLPQIIAFFYSKGHWSGWKEPALDAMIDKANQADGPERVALVGQLIKKLRDDASAVPLFAHEVVYAAAPSLKWRPRADDLIVAEEIG
ncbi:ABC transporter substrate-binding protein [Microvirga zambiensis]|uniref:ABC transporter substrate-binding protein n=1 Tax=Microvirga zambiensis TaxID=1402137 RepID=UPI00191DAF8E|nr:ABC transporter substrate-binding protein [Microvirga zambiensis]